MDLRKKRVFQFLHKLTLSLQKKKKIITVDAFKDSDSVLLFLFEMRLIKNYKTFENNNKLKLTVELSYDRNGKSIINGIRPIPQGRYNEHANLKNLLRFTKRQTPPIYGLLETRKGILPLHLCIKRKMGGYVLFWIY